MSAMRETMMAQADRLSELLADGAPVDQVADRLHGRRVMVIGTGTSWHAAAQGAYLLRAAGLDAVAVESAEAAVGRPLPGRGEVLLALTHTGRKRFTAEAADRARRGEADVIQISGTAVAHADLHTVERERSSAFTVSHLAALLRIAQLARALGAELGELDVVPGAVERAFQEQREAVGVPQRLIEFIGGGINQWTAAEGALKIREAAYVASEGLSAEQFLHGPAVALRSQDRLVCLDGGGPVWPERIASIADVAESSGVPVTRTSYTEVGELLSIFPLTVAVQRIALESAEALGANPDSFGRDVPGREAWENVRL
jgi:glucosamine--fructose-6-phosphate aminotransferase (isomerizing)